MWSITAVFLKVDLDCSKLRREKSKLQFVYIVDLKVDVDVASSPPHQLAAVPFRWQTAKKGSHSQVLALILAKRSGDVVVDELEERARVGLTLFVLFGQQYLAVDGRRVFVELLSASDDDAVVAL